MKSVRDTVLYTVLPLGVNAAVAGVVSARTAVPFWTALAIGMAAVMANGLLATLEDDLTGGFNHPDGTSTPRYAVVVTKIVRWTAAAVCVALAVASIAAGLRYSHHAERVIGAGVAVLFLGAALLMIRRRREARVAAAVGVLAVLVAMILN